MSLSASYNYQELWHVLRRTTEMVCFGNGTNRKVVSVAAFFAIKTGGVHQWRPPATSCAIRASKTVRIHDTVAETERE